MVVRDLDEKKAKELFTYDPLDGVLRWAKNGKPAGTKDNRGYYRVCVDYKRFLNHRIIWTLVYGLPTGTVDHINRNRSDNRISNLRDISDTQNSRNRKLHKNNSSGVTGVYWYNPTKSWLVKIGVGGVGKHIGFFKSFEEAVEKRKEAESQYGY